MKFDEIAIYKYLAIFGFVLLDFALFKGILPFMISSTDDLMVYGGMFITAGSLFAQVVFFYVYVFNKE